MDMPTRTDTTRYVHQMFDAIKDKIGDMDARMMLRHRSSDAHMEGRYAIVYELEVTIDEKIYAVQEEVGSEIQQQGYWATQESVVWRRLCISLYAALTARIEGFREGLSVPPWLA